MSEIGKYLQIIYVDAFLCKTVWDIWFLDGFTQELWSAVCENN